MCELAKIFPFCLLLLSVLAFCQPFAPADTITVIFGGDVMLARNVGAIIARNGVNYPWLKIAKFLREADLAIVNLECVVGTQTRCVRKKYNFQAAPSVLAGLKFAGIDAVSLANNHIYDYFGAGVCETVDSLTKAGIVPIGAGRDISDFAAPASFWIRGNWIVVMGFNDTASGFWGKDEPGCMPTWQEWAESLAVEQVSAMSDLGACVIVFEHWGWEYDTIPRERQIDLARRFIDAGAVAVIGSHPHRVQKIERYRGGVIAYSLGNLIFDQKDTLGNIGILLKVGIACGKLVNVNIIPVETLTNPAQPTPISDERIKALMGKVVSNYGSDI